MSMLSLMPYTKQTLTTTTTTPTTTTMFNMPPSASGLSSIVQQAGLLLLLIAIIAIISITEITPTTTGGGGGDDRFKKHPSKWTAGMHFAYVDRWQDDYNFKYGCGFRRSEEEISVRWPVFTDVRRVPYPESPRMEWLNIKLKQTPKPLIRKKRVVGGYISMFWPNAHQTVAIVKRRLTNGTYEFDNLDILCTGTILTKHHILTSERCVRENVTNVKDWQSEVRVGQVGWEWLQNPDFFYPNFLVGNDTQEIEGEAKNLFKIKDICLDKVRRPDELAILYLDNPRWKFNQASACLPTPFRLRDGTNQQFYIDGYGNHGQDGKLHRPYLLPVRPPFEPAKCARFRDKLRFAPTRLCTTSSLRGLGNTCVGLGDQGAPIYGLSRLNRQYVLGIAVDQVDPNCELFTDPMRKELLTIYAVNLTYQIERGWFTRALRRNKCGFQATTRPPRTDGREDLYDTTPIQ